MQTGPGCGVRRKVDGKVPDRGDLRPSSEQGGAPDARTIRTSCFARPGQIAPTAVDVLPPVPRRGPAAFPVESDLDQAGDPVGSPSAPFSRVALPRNPTGQLRMILICAAGFA